MKQYDFNNNFCDFRKELDLTETDNIKLLKARKVLRASIRKAFNENQSKYFTQETIRLLSEFTTSTDKKIKPLFMSQGSFVYKTINLPSNPPTQQMDLDDGVYLPLSYIENESRTGFHKAANIVRDVIYMCVHDVCNENSWKLKKHPNCLRITISSKAHIDLPIYSIPDEETHTIKEAATSNHASTIQLDDLASRFLAFDKATNILLATDNGWLKSDPREIQEWVKNMKHTYGNEFTFYSRYIKAWRDYQYPLDSSKFSSIMIMSAIAKAFSEYSYSKNKNIALDLSMIVNSLKLYISGNGIPHPTEDKRLDESLPDRGSLIRSLNSLSISLNKAAKTNDAALLVTMFGSRFPATTGVSEKVIIPSIIAPTYSTPIKPAKTH